MFLVPWLVSGTRESSAYLLRRTSLMYTVCNHAGHDSAWSYPLSYSLSEMLWVRHVLYYAELFQTADVKGRRGIREKRFSFLLASTYHKCRSCQTYALEKLKITPQMTLCTRELLWFALEFKWNLSSFSLQIEISAENKGTSEGYSLGSFCKEFFSLSWSGDHQDWTLAPATSSRLQWLCL